MDLRARVTLGFCPVMIGQVGQRTVELLLVDGCLTDAHVDDDLLEARDLVDVVVARSQS